MNYKKLITVLALCFLTQAIALEKTSQEVAREKLLMLFSGEWVSRGLYVATKLEISDHLVAGPQSIEELAKSTHTNPESLSRLLNLLASFGIFEEVSPGVFTNTDSSLLLAKSHAESLHALSVFYGEDIHKSWEELLQSMQINTPAFQLVFKEPVFSYFKNNPLKAALFQEAMKEKSRAVIQSALSSYDFSQFTSIYDIGGGKGQFMRALLQQHPHIQGLLFELPEVIETSQLNDASLKLHKGDFFKFIPSGGDAYILKSVLHDWNNDEAEKILKNCHRAMGKNSRLLIIEVVLQQTPVANYAQCMDFLMFAITGGKERTLQAFEQLLDHSGFVVQQIYPTATEFSILEVRKK